MTALSSFWEIGGVCWCFEVCNMVCSLDVKTDGLLLEKIMELKGIKG